MQGERLFLARKSHPVPRHHLRMARGLAALSFVGITVLVYGLAVLHAWPTLTGLLLAMGAKAWFVDRMVWLYEDMGRARAGRGGA